MRCFAVPAAPARPLAVDTHGRRFHVEWDPHAAVTPLGQLVFFSQFLATAGLFRDWVQTCPLTFTRPNAPLLPDLLGTMTLAVLAGQNRCAHVTALRADAVNPQGLGMAKVCSEDSVRRAFAGADPHACAAWQTGAPQQTWLPALRQPWVLDLDVTVKPICGQQEGAELGYNPHKPGRPSHTCHTLFVRGLRLVLDVQVRSGKQHSATHSRENLWRVWESLPKDCRPWLLCGDASHGHEGLLAESETRGQPYLFRLRQSPGVKQLVRLLESQGGWRPALHGYEGAEGQLQLSGWTAKRRVPVLRRRRADAENVYDELKNQWGWGGFTTRDLLRCQVAARQVALAYNWWSLFVRCAEPARPREAVTGRPLLLCAVGRVVESGRQLTLRLTSTHAEAARAQALLTGLSLFLSGLQNAAEQLSPADCWERIWARIWAPWRRPAAALPGPSG